MCRIAGIINYNGLRVSQEILTKMRESLIHGGPDSGSNYIDENVGFSHRRLSIIDLSDAGAQPMAWNNWVISFNGEIYNYSAIKEKLIEKGYKFTTKTDTEVIIKAFDCFGKDVVNEFHGMYAFALWNKDTRKLLLCRDRLGVKPLFWYFKDDIFMFASEITAFKEHPSFNKTINLNSISHYLQKGFIRTSESIFKFVNKVPNGSFLEIDDRKKINLSNYYDISRVFSESTIITLPEEEIHNKLENILQKSFNYRMVSDVEVGIFLSGGIDSSLLTAILQKNSNKTLSTFTIGFSDKRFDESETASKISEIIGTNHTKIICTEDDFKNTIPTLFDIYDEPVGDSSVIPTVLLSKLVHNSVKVALSGDGGDELFLGYAKYQFMKYSDSLLKIPFFLRRFMNCSLNNINPDSIESISARMGFKEYTQISNKYYKFKQILLAQNNEDYFELASSFSARKDIQDLTHNKDFLVYAGKEKHPLSYYAMKDMMSYLPGDILTKVDRASMHFALEVREPYLDQDLIEFAFSLPEDMKMTKKNDGKYILKSLLSKYLPPELINRPKQGFTIPVAIWLKGVLKEELICLRNDKIFFEIFELNVIVWDNILSSFLRGNYKYNPYLIWFVFCLYKWHKKWS